MRALHRSCAWSLLVSSTRKELGFSQRCHPLPISFFPQLQQLDNNAIGVPDIACQTIFNRTSFHTGDSALARCAGRQQFVPCPCDVVYLETDMCSTGQSRLRRRTIDCAAQILDEFDMMSV